ncbi:MAG: sulfatase-like hydrolase/transferase [Pirellulaceae bacterium]
MPSPLLNLVNALGCYGNTVVQSPSIDRLAQRGVTFSRACCQQAVCSPSRSSVMTGMRPDTTKLWDLRTHLRKALPDVVTLSHSFRKNGYTTRGLGKVYHSGFDDPESWSSPAKNSKRIRRSTSANSSTFDAATGPAPDEFANVTGAMLTKTDRGLAYGASDDLPDVGGDGAVADAAIAALREFKAQARPFLLGERDRWANDSFDRTTHRTVSPALQT